METVNATHVANWGLSSLYHLTLDGAPAVEVLEEAHARWRQLVREYEADPPAWDRAYYQQMIRDFVKAHGSDQARAFGARLVASGEMREEDLEEALAQ